MRQKIMTSGLLLALFSMLTSKEKPNEQSLALYSPINICLG